MLRLKVKQYSSPEQVISRVGGITCHRGSHSVACHLTQVNTPCRNPRKRGRYSVYLPQTEGRLNCARWLVITETV